MAGPGFDLNVLNRFVSFGSPILRGTSGPLRSYLESVSLFTGLGILILAVGGVAMGRLSLVAAKDVADADDYYAGSSAASTASLARLEPLPHSCRSVPERLHGPAPGHQPLGLNRTAV